MQIRANLPRQFSGNHSLLVVCVVSATLLASIGCRANWRGCSCRRCHHSSIVADINGPSHNSLSSTQESDQHLTIDGNVHQIWDQAKHEHPKANHSFILGWKQGYSWAKKHQLGIPLASSDPLPILAQASDHHWRAGCRAGINTAVDHQIGEQIAAEKIDVRQLIPLATISSQSIRAESNVADQPELSLENRTPTQPPAQTPSLNDLVPQSTQQTECDAITNQNSLISEDLLNIDAIERTNPDVDWEPINETQETTLAGQHESAVTRAEPDLDAAPVWEGESVLVSEPLVNRAPANSAPRSSAARSSQPTYSAIQSELPSNHDTPISLQHNGLRGPTPLLGQVQPPQHLDPGNQPSAFLTESSVLVPFSELTGTPKLIARPISALINKGNTGRILTYPGSSKAKIVEPEYFIPPSAIYRIPASQPVQGPIDSDDALRSRITPEANVDPRQATPYKDEFVR